MRKGQITLFIILGLVFLISIIILFAARSSLIQPPSTEVTADETLTRTCLTRVTEVALAGLHDDAVLRTTQAGTLEGDLGNHTYLFYRNKQELGEQNYLWPTGEPATTPYGTMNYTGLCDTQGLNALHMFLPQRYSCSSRVYHYANHSSIQQQLEVSITNQMQDCLGQALDEEEVAGNAEVIIQHQGIVIRWTDPEVQYNPRTPLHPVWRAIREALEQETSVDEFSPERMMCGEYPDRVLNCRGCQTVTFEDITGTQGIPAKSKNFPYNAWAFSVGGETYATILLENRNISYKTTLPTGHTVYNETYELELRHGGLTTGLSAQDTFDEGDVLLFLNYTTLLYTFDDDYISLEVREDFGENDWYFQDNDEERCYFRHEETNQEAEAPCWPQIPTRMSKPDPGYVCEVPGENYAPHVNQFGAQLGCNKAVVYLNATDQATSEMLLNASIPALPQLAFTWWHDTEDTCDPTDEEYMENLGPNKDCRGTPPTEHIRQTEFIECACPGGCDT